MKSTMKYAFALDAEDAGALRDAVKWHGGAVIGRVDVLHHLPD